MLLTDISGHCVSQMLPVVGAQMCDGRLDALFGMLKPKSRIASSPVDVRLESNASVQHNK